MFRLHPRTLKQTAAQQLARSSYSPRKLMALHTGVSLAVSLVLFFLDHYLNKQINNTGGLSGMDTRAYLSTIQQFLMLVPFILAFWNIGFLRAAISMGRNEPVGPGSLLEGFRRFGPVLRLMVLRIVFFSSVLICCIYAGTMVYFMTPAATPYIELMLPLMEDMSVLNPELALDEATVAALIEALWPAYLIGGVLFIGALIPLSNKLRLADYIILDNQPAGAFASALKSWKLTGGHFWQLIRLDLSFWWFYALQLLLAAIAYLDIILAEVGIALPENAFLWLYLLQAAGQLALFWWAGSYVQTTYAVTYDALQQDAGLPVVPPQAP